MKIKIKFFLLFFLVLNIFWILKSEEASKKEISIGCTTDLEGIFFLQAKFYYEGLKMGIDEENSLGGINKTKIKLIALNDKFNPNIALENIKFFLDKNIDILLNPMGSFALTGYLDYIKNKKILVLFPRAISENFRKPDLKYIVHFLSSIKNETKVLLDYAYKNFNFKKIAFIYENEPYSHGAYEETVKYLNFLGFKNFKNKNNQNKDKSWLELESKKNSNLSQETKFTEEIKKFNPTIIAFLNLPYKNKILLQNLNFDYLKNKIFIFLSTIDEETENNLKNNNILYIKSFLTPRYSPEETLPIAQEFKKSLKNFDIKNAIYSFEGYIYAKLFVDICKKIEGDITKEKILEQIEKIKDYNFKGINLNFDPIRRELQNSVWLQTEKNKFLKIDPKTIQDEN